MVFDDVLVQIEKEALGLTDEAVSVGDVVEADIPGVATKLVAAVHVMQEFCTGVHALLMQHFPSDHLTSPTANGATSATNIVTTTASEIPPAKTASDTTLTTETGEPFTLTPNIIDNKPTSTANPDTKTEGT